MTSYPYSPTAAPIDITALLVAPPKVLTWTIWPAARPEQKHVATDGWCETGTWAQLCRWVETEHAGAIYAKGRGPQWAPVANKDGHRCIASTTAMYAMTFDCDGVGDWVTLLAALDAMGAAYLAYRSSSHTPECPKWRLVLLFAEPYVTQDNPTKANEEWHRLYEHVRVILGTLAAFADPVNSGFDHTTSDIARIFYLGHRRTPDVPVREVRWRGGLALDGKALLATAPSTPTKSRTPTSRSPSPAVSGGVQMLDLSAPGQRDTGIYTVEVLPADTLITLTRDGVDVGTVKFGDVAAKQQYRHHHCRCPKHGGSGRGSAWVFVTPQGVRLRCSKCRITWHRDVTVTASPRLLAVIEAERQETLAEREAHAKATARRPEIWKEYEARLAARRALAEALDPVRIDLAEMAFRLTTDLLPVIESNLHEKGLPETAPECGFTQGVGDAFTSSGTILRRRCSRLSCPRCGPRLVATKAAAILVCGVLDDDGRVVGRGLGSRPELHAYTMDADRVASWTRAWSRATESPEQSARRKQANRVREAARRRRLKPEVGSTEAACVRDASSTSLKTHLGHTHTQHAPCTKSKATTGQAYVAFWQGIGGEGRPQKVTVLSTVAVPGRWVPSDIHRGPDATREAVLDLVMQTYRVATALRITEPVGDVTCWCMSRMNEALVYGDITSSRGLMLDPDEVRRLATPHQSVLVEPRVCSVREATRRWRETRIGLRPVDGCHRAVTTEAINDPETWKRLWDAVRARPKASRPEPEPEDIDETDDMPPVWDEPTPEALEAARDALDDGSAWWPRK